jgi:hypothetical protein
MAALFVIGYGGGFAALLYVVRSWSAHHQAELKQRAEDRELLRRIAAKVLGDDPSILGR